MRRVKLSLLRHSLTNSVSDACHKHVMALSAEVSSRTHLYLEDSGEEETAILPQGEELAEEEEESQDTVQNREDHQPLDQLDPPWGGGVERKMNRKLRQSQCLEFVRTKSRHHFHLKLFPCEWQSTKRAHLVIF